MPSGTTGLNQKSVLSSMRVGIMGNEKDQRKELWGQRTNILFIHMMQSKEQGTRS